MHPKELKKENVKFDDAKDVFVTLAGERTRDIRLKGHKRAAIAHKIVFGKDAISTTAPLILLGVGRW